MKRRRAREYALQLLFEYEFSGSEPDVARFFSDKGESEEVVEFATRIYLGAVEHWDEIDAAVSETSEHWVLERMASVDRNIIRAAAFELMFTRDIPPAVAMDEAIEIAKKYSSEEAAAFINGILDKIAKTRRPA